MVQVKAGTIFDNILVTDDLAHALKFAEDTWGAMKDVSGLPTIAGSYPSLAGASLIPAVPLSRCLAWLRAAERYEIPC